VSATPSPSAEEALRAANALLRQVIEAMDRELAAERAARERLELRLAELERRLGMDSSNSGTPTSKESIEAAARRKAAQRASQRERSKERKSGGQKGRRGAGLEPARGDHIDDMRQAEPPAECSGCGDALADGVVAGRTWGQVWDIAPITLSKVHWLLPKVRCTGCGRTTCADPPFGRAGTVAYGPNVNAAAILLASEGNVPVERTAMVMEALLGTRVSPGFVAKAHQRFADRLQAAGLDEAMKTALRAEDVLCGDETPVNVLRKDTEPLTGRDKPGSPQVITLRTPDPRLVWFAPISARSSAELAGLGVLEDWRGILVRDDYRGWQQFDDTLTAVQQCASHLLRHLQGVAALHPTWQQWASQVQQVLREANLAVQRALTDGRDHLDPDLLADLRRRYDNAVAWGEATNRHRDWHEGNHPGYVLARRLAAKAEQVWTFTRNFAVPWTNNASEQALKGPKRHQAVSGYWHTMATLGRYCRVRSYLVTTKGHGIRAIDAIHAVLAGRPWLPTPIAA
jgi:transposase